MYAIYQGINNVEELECVENKKAEAKYKYIAEQFIKIIYSSLPGFGRIEVQESWLYASRDIGVFNQSSIVNKGINQSTLGMPNLSRGVITGNKDVPFGRPSGL